MIRRKVAPALALAVATAWALTGCGGGGNGGDKRVDGVSHMTGSVVPVQLPTGRLRLTLAKPRSAVSAAQAADGRRHEAPDGQAYLGVGWAFQPEAGLPTWQRAFVVNDKAVASLALAVDGKTYSIGSVNSSGLPVYVLVPKGGDPHVEVTFAGVTQRIDVATSKRDPGRAAALYRQQPNIPVSHGCANGDWNARVAGLTCAYWAARMPYLPSLGWRRAGWLVVSVRAGAAAVHRGGHDYPVATMSDASRLAGAKPAATLLPHAHDLPSSKPGLQRYLAFAAGGGSLRIVRVLKLDSDHGHRPPRRTVTISTTVRL